MGYKPRVVEQTKFDKKEGLLKRLKDIEDTAKDQIKSQSKPIENDVDSANKNAFKELRSLSELR